MVGGNDAMSINTDPSVMKTLSTSTWLSTFRSMENISHRTFKNSSHRTFASMREVLEDEKYCDDKISALDLAVPPTPLDRMASLHKMKLANPKSATVRCYPSLRAVPPTETRK
jgi:hypothetical protein